MPWKNATLAFITAQEMKQFFRLKVTLSVFCQCAMASDLQGLVKECLGPHLRVCPEQVVRDMERARMTAEDYRQGNAPCEHNPNFLTWRKLEHCRKLRMEDADQTIKNIADVVKWHENGQTDASGRPLTDEDCFTQIRAEVQAHGFLNSSDDEMSDEEPDDTSMADDDGSEEESEVHCALCNTSGDHRMYFNMEPQGRWAGLAPGARIVCDMCYRDDMGVRASICYGRSGVVLLRDL